MLRQFLRYVYVLYNLSSGPPGITDREYTGIRRPEIPGGNSREF